MIWAPAGVTITSSSMRAAETPSGWLLGQGAQASNGSAGSENGRVLDEPCAVLAEPPAALDQFPRGRNEVATLLDHQVIVKDLHGRDCSHAAAYQRQAAATGTRWAWCATW